MEPDGNTPGPIPPHKRKQRLAPHLRTQSHAAVKGNTSMAVCNAGTEERNSDELGKLAGSGITLTTISPTSWSAEIRQPLGRSRRADFEPRPSDPWYAHVQSNDIAPVWKAEPASLDEVPSQRSVPSNEHQARRDESERGRSRTRRLHRRMHSEAALDPATSTPRKPENIKLSENGKANRRSAWKPHGPALKADVRREKINWSSQSSGLSVPSGWTSVCAADRSAARLQRRSFESGNELSNWQGDWAPAPLDWDGRPAFRNKQSAAQIDAWLRSTGDALSNMLGTLSILDKQGEDGTAACFSMGSMPTKEHGSVNLDYIGEIAPSYWIPGQIEGKSPDAFWNEHKISYTPKPCDQDDLKEALPWWSRLSQYRDFLLDIPAPVIIGIDPDESHYERIARENDFGSAQHTQNRIRKERAKKESKLRRHHQAEERRRRIMSWMSEPPSEMELVSRRIIPGSRFGIRSARIADIPGILDIYNYYIEHSCQAPETDKRSHEDMCELFRDVRDSEFPFLVAFEPGQVIKPRRSKNKMQTKYNGEFVTLADTILGFVYVQNYSKGPSQYDSTVQVRFFTHHLHYRKCVAKCLMDQLLRMLDANYLERGGFKVDGDELQGYSSPHVINHIMLQVPYYDARKLDWLWMWIERWLGFQEVRDLRNVGTKFDRKVSIAIFQRANILQPTNQGHDKVTGAGDAT